MPSVESKAARKNKKRRAAHKNDPKASSSAEGFEIEEDTSVPRPVPSAASTTDPLNPAPPPPPPVVDPIADLKRQIEEAKAAKVRRHTLYHYTSHRKSMILARNLRVLLLNKLNLQAL